MFKYLLVFALGLAGDFANPVDLVGDDGFWIKVSEACAMLETWVGRYATEKERRRQATKTKRMK